MDPGSSGTMWYIVGAAVVVAIAGLALWYYTAQAPSVDMQAPTMGAETSNTQVSQEMPLSRGTSVADIQADLDQTPDSTVALNQAAAASAQDIQSF